MSSREPETPERFGPFVLLRQLGVGGMGSAHLAMHAENGELLVVKRMHPELLADESIFKRFVHEAEVATHVRHPNVAALRAMGAVDQEPFLATEFVFGIQVSHIVERVESSQIDPIPLGVGLFLAVELVSGIEAVHLACHRETGAPLSLIHRDIGARNVLVGFDGQIRVIDLGLGKSILSDWQTAAQVLAGSPDYMPPEQAMGVRVDGRADVYSAAVTIWELLAGRKRIREEGIAARLSRAIQAQPEPLLGFRPDAPKRLEAILKQAMHPDPELRTPTATIFKRALGEILHERARNVTKSDVVAWLDSACATVIAKERRSLAEARARGAAFVGRTRSAARTELFVGRPGAIELGSHLELSDAVAATITRREERPSVEVRPAPVEAPAAAWSQLASEVRENVAKLATSPSVASLAALVDPENFRRQSPLARVALIGGAFFVLVTIATVTALLVRPPDRVEVTPLSEPLPVAEAPIGRPAIPARATLEPRPAAPDELAATEPRAVVAEGEAAGVEGDPRGVESGGRPEGIEPRPGGDGPAQPPVRLSPEVSARKSELVRRIKQLRRVRFDLDFQKRLTQLSARLSRARSAKALDELEASLVRMEAER